jgi:hypothetical protein
MAHTCGGKFDVERLRRFWNQATLVLGAFRSTGPVHEAFESLAGRLKAADSIVTMFGVHGAEKIPSGFMAGFVLEAAPMNAEAVAEAKISLRPK